MLILIVVIAILATNLFLGFFIAHYLGYGPQNFDELWTGVYLRPMGPSRSEIQSQSIDRVILDALTQAAAAQPLLPTEPVVMLRSESAKKLSDGELVTTMMHANLALHQAGLVIDRLRLIEPHAAETFAGFPDFQWSRETATESLKVWQDCLQTIGPAEEIAWWKSYLAQWMSTHQAWLNYQGSLVSIGRILEVEQKFSKQQPAVVCEDGSCRIVGNQPSDQAWWKRTPAELKTLAWVHGQLDQLHQEAFDHFVLFRRESRQLQERTLGWARQTFKPERLAGWVAKFDQRWSWAGLPAVITDLNKQDGFLLLLSTHENWIAEFGWGSVVADAILHHRSKCLDRWFVSVPSVSAGTVLPLRQTIHDRAVAIWISAENPESARIAAWTIADKLELTRRRLEPHEVHLPCRVLVVPLNSKRTARAAIGQSMRILDNSEHAIWMDCGSHVWSLERRGPQAVPRPDALPLVESTMDLAQWYVEWRLGVGLALPQPTSVSAENVGEGATDPVPSEPHSASGDDSQGVGDGIADPLPTEDDGIEW